MTGRIFRACKALASSVKSSNVNGLTRYGATTSFLIPQLVLVQSTRNTNFFMKRPAAQLWKSVTSVSNAGKRRGRGKGLPKIKDLNFGQRLGMGKVPIIFPGLNSPVMQGKNLSQPHRIQPDEQKLTVPEVEITPRKRRKIHPLERGWSGGKSGGRKIGPPDPVDEDAFEGFQSWILYHRTVSIMTSSFGRSKRSRCMVVTGNGNGLAGFAITDASDHRSVLTKTKNRAGQRLLYIERYNNHTVLHDFFTQFGSTKIFVKQKHKGYGLKCHRVIKACCEAIGITDLHCKVEGSLNISYIVKAFFIGLLQQKTYEDMAKEKKLHLVEIKKENNYFPTVLASPPVTRDAADIEPNEDLDFKRYIMDGRVPFEKPKRLPFYTKLPSWLIYQRRYERRRGQSDVILKLRAEYDGICSFLTEKYPEARAQRLKKHEKNKEEESEI